MFTIAYKIVVGWLMPPGCFVLLFLFCAWKTRSIGDPSARKTLRSLALVGAVGLYLLSVQPVSRLLSWGLEKQHPPVIESQIKKSNAVVVLSAGVVEGAPVSFSPTSATPGQAAVVRLCEGVRLYRKIKSEGRACTVVLTGGRFFGERAASEVSREWLTFMGVPVGDIRVETSSRTTFEEARSALPVVRAVGAEAVFLVTHAYHMPRAVAAFDKCGMPVTPAPCGFSSSGNLNVFSFLPDAATLSENRAMLWEYLGAAFYWFK